MGAGYVEQREGWYYVTWSRVSLDSVAYAFLRGESPEGGHIVTVILCSVLGRSGFSPLIHARCAAKSCAGTM